MLAIVSAFHAPLAYGDIAIVELTVKETGRSSMKLGYDIRRKRDGVKCFHADISTVLVDLDSMKPKTIEPALRHILEQFLSG